MFGFFGVKEDDVYDVVFKYVCNLGLLWVYIVFNFGVCIGFVEEFKSYFKIAWIDDFNLGMGFKYFYFILDDYKVFLEGIVVVEEIVEGGEMCMKFIDIIG